MGRSTPNFETGCKFKQQYDSSGDAKKATIKRKNQGSKARLEPYKCVFCGKWHIGKARLRQATRIVPYDKLRRSERKSRYDWRNLDER